MSVDHLMGTHENTGARTPYTPRQDVSNQGGSQIFGAPIASESSLVPPTSPVILGVKRSMDVVLAGLGALVLWPVGCLIALLVLLEDGFPIFYVARRTGRGGHPFAMYKFRTMWRDAATRGPAITSANDPRITRVGRLLRATRLDELPQVWNVLRGDMSIVGPRPEDPAYVALYTSAQRVVLAVRPGITGPAQLRFSDEAQLLRPGHVHEDYVSRVLPIKLAIDAEYVAHLTIWRDVLSIAATIGAMCGKRPREAGTEVNRILTQIQTDY